MLASSERLSPLSDLRGQPTTASTSAGSIEGSSMAAARTEEPTTSPPPKLPPLFSRFHNLLHPELQPDAPPARSLGDAVPPHDAALIDALNPDGRDTLKIRFLTWNMHESLPKGDLTPLLGAVPAYAAPPPDVLDSGRLPQLPLHDDGPPTYHMIVISGQETPTPSGIPLGLAAVKWGAGQSHTSTPSATSHPHNSPLLSLSAPPPSSPQAPSRVSAGGHSPGKTTPSPEPAASGAAPLQPPTLALMPSTPPGTQEDPSPAPSTAATLPGKAAAAPGFKSNLSLQIPGSSTSSVAVSSATSRSGSPTSSRSAGHSGYSAADVGLPDSGPKTSDAPHADTKAELVKGQAPAPSKASHSRVSESKGWSDLLEDWFCNRAGEPMQRPSAAPSADASDVEEDAGLAIPSEPSHSKANARVVEEGKGSYQLVRKERMLGIYLAVFVWKGCSHLLQSTSSSYVTTGLIGGRWGNKGGVAVSVKLASKRLLFINSHLAAHASRSDVRLLNVAKIKSELSIDAFLESGDHRVLLEDPTDRFDSTFWCGDLNFRLDVSRLHADWLMSQKAYHEAFQFDQLRKIMAEKRGFEGFKEAHIDFPPTYKYDLFKPVKRSITKTSKRRKNKSLSEVQEDNVVVEEEGEEEDEIDSSSIMSNGWTSVGQQSDYAASEAEVDLDDDLPEPASLQQQSQILAGKVVSETKKLFLPSTVLKGKRKILNLIKAPSSPATPSSAEKRSLSSSLPGSSPYTPRSGSTTSFDLDRKKSVNSHSSSFGTGAPSSALSSSPPPRKSLDAEGSPPRPAITRQLSSKIRRSFSGRLDLGPTSRDIASDDDTDDENADPSSSVRTSGLTSDVYDTSAKARVPSWCDRILYKSFEEDYPPPPPMPSSEPERPDEPSAPLFSRLDRFTSALNLRKPARLNRSVSAGSQLSQASRAPTIGEQGPSQGPSTSSSQISLHNPASTPPTNASAVPSLAPALSPSAIRTTHVHWETGSSQLDGDAPISPAPSRRSSLGRLVLRQRSNSASHAADDPSDAEKRAATLPHLDLHAADDRRKPPHRSNTAPLSSDSPTASPSSPFAHRPDLVDTRHISAPPTTANENRSSWFSRLLTTLSHGTSSTEDLAGASAPAPQRVVRKRGEVLPLRYGTLNDQEMRVLKGYSDHRPVIGVYAIFI